MEFRRPTQHNFKDMLTLQNSNLVTSLNQTERADGFLTACFTEQQFQAMNEDLCVVVCENAGKIIGYACASSISYNRNVPLVAAMLKQFPDIIYNEKPLSAYPAFIYGPVCIDKDYRGKGILAQLFDQMIRIVQQEQNQLELLTVPISSENQRSLNAHQKLGMTIVSQFPYNDKIFCNLVLPIQN